MARGPRSLCLIGDRRSAFGDGAVSRRARSDRAVASDAAEIGGFEAAGASSHGQDGRRAPQELSEIVPALLAEAQSET